MTTVPTTKEERLEIMKYILAVMDMDETKAEGLAEAGCSTPKLILRMSEQNFAGLYKAKKVNRIELEILGVFRLFLKDLLKGGGKLPVSFDEWTSFFTAKEFDLFHDELDATDEAEEKEVDDPDDEDDEGDQGPNDDEDLSQGGIPKNVVIGGGKSVAGSIAGSHGKKMVKVSLSDFPTFSGKQEEWMPFSKDVMSTMSLLHLEFLLDVKTEKEVAKHLKLRKSDDEYNTRVKEFYSVLSKKTVKGTAASQVDVYLNERDGALVWKDLCAFYNFGGDKEARITWILGELTSLKLRHDTHGGFDKFQDEFGKKCLELAHMEMDLQDVLKKSIFLQGIEDVAYTAVKDDCKKVSFRETVELLRSKSRDLSKTNHGGGGGRRRQNRKTKKNNDSDSESEPWQPVIRRKNLKKTGDDDWEKGSGFSKETWGAMSQENRMWIQSQKNKKKEEYGRQYSDEGPSPRKTNAKKSVDSDDETTKSVKFAEDSDDESIKSAKTEKKPVQSIFRKPGASRKKNMLRRLPADPDDRDPNVPVSMVIPDIDEESLDGIARGPGLDIGDGILMDLTNRTKKGHGRSNVWRTEVIHSPLKYDDVEIVIVISEWNDDLTRWVIYRMTIEQAKEYHPKELTRHVLHYYGRDNNHLWWRHFSLVEWATEYERANPSWSLDDPVPYGPPQNLKSRIESRNSQRSLNHIVTRVMDPAVLFNKSVIPVSTLSGTDEMIIDGGADTCSIGGEAWHIDFKSGRFVNVAGYDEKAGTIRSNVQIGGGVTAMDLPNGETILLRVNEATIMDDANTLLSTFQARDSGVYIDDRAKRHGGSSYIGVDDYVLPLEVRGALQTLPIRKPTEQELKDCLMIELTSDAPWHPDLMRDKPLSPTDYEEMQEDFEARRTNLSRARQGQPDYDTMEKFLLHPGKEVINQTIKHTTAVGTINARFPMRQHYRSRNPLLQRRRLNEGVATDTIFATATSYEGYNCSQIFVGMESKMVANHGMKREGDGPEALLDYFRNDGVPTCLLRDNSRMQCGKLWTEYMRNYWVTDAFIEPYHPNQNHSERYMTVFKEKCDRLYIVSGAPVEAWFKLASHVGDVMNHTANESLDYRTPIECRDAHTPDISGLLQFQFWDLVYFYDVNHKFPAEGGNERLGRWMGRAKNYGDQMCYWILDIETNEPIVRSMVRSTMDIRPNLAYETKIVSETEADEERRREGGVNPLIFHKTGDRVVNDDGTEEVKASLKEITTKDLLNLLVWDTFKTRTGKETTVRGTIAELVDEETYRVNFNNGKQKLYDYNELIDMLTKQEDSDAEYWEFDEVVDHRYSKIPNRKGKIDVKVKWTNHEEATWEPMEAIKKDDPVTLAKYAEENDLVRLSAWNWAHRYLKNEKKFTRALKQVRLNAKRCGRGIRYKFGVQVPRTIQEARDLDRRAGNSKWIEAVTKEVNLLRDLYQCFKPADAGEITDEYQKIPLLWVFDVKFDGRYRARCVAGGHMTENIQFDMYSGVVDLESIRIAFIIAALTDLKVIAADIGSAYIQALTVEKVYCIPGSEFGELHGIVCIIMRALYGLKLSSAMWHQKLSDTLRAMGFVPSKADYDLWMRACVDHYEYVGVIVDDLLVFSKNPSNVIGPLKEIYNFELKGVGEPEYYSGADMSINEETGLWEMSAKTYVSNVCDKIEKLFECKLKRYGAPMEANDHPEMDDSDFLTGDEITRYQMLIGSAQWAVTLGRFDVQYAVNTMARYSSQPREGHMKRMLHVFGYLNANIKTRIAFDPSDPNLEDFEFVNNDWGHLYDYAEEDSDPDTPEPLSGKEIVQTVMVDASHASDLLTRRSVTAMIIFLGQTPTKWYSKRQNTVEAATYGSELVALRIAVEAALGMRYKLRMLGMKVTRRAVVMCDNMSVVCNMHLPSSTLKKKHQAVAWHKCRETIAMGAVGVAHIRSEDNTADIGTKPKGPIDTYRLVKVPLYGKFD